MTIIALPKDGNDVCVECDHIRFSHYEGRNQHCNSKLCQCEGFKTIKGSFPVESVAYFSPPKESVSYYIEKLEDLTKEYPKDHPEFGKLHGGYHFVDGDTIAIESEFGVLLMDEIEEFKPSEIVEIGTGRGYSTAWILLGMGLAGKGNLTTFDEQLRNLHVNQIPIPGHFTMYITDFKKAKDLLPKTIDFVFHDAAHTPDLIIKDLEIILPRMSLKGRIWIHDAYDEISIPLKVYFESKGWKYKWLKESSHLGFARMI